MNKYSRHDYQNSWLDSRGHHQKWSSIDNDYLRNIHKKIKFLTNTFPSSALIACELELRSRQMSYPLNPHGPNTPKYEQAIVPVQIIPRIKDEELLSYFGKKVLLGDGVTTGTVVAIRHSKSQGLNRPPQLEIRLATSSMNIDAHEVTVVKQIAVFGYQHKNGEITWTSKDILPSVLKKQGLKKLDSATRYFDI